MSNGLAAASAPVSMGERTDALIGRIKNGMGDADCKVQGRLADAIILANDCRSKGREDALEPLEAAVEALLKQPARIAFAAEVLRSLRREIPSVNPTFKESLYGGSPQVYVMVGLLCCVSLSSLYMSLNFPTSEITLPMLSLSRRLVWILGFCGAMGSVISIMVRIRDFDNSKGDWTPLTAFLTGFLKPFIGAAFGLFAYGAIKSGMIPLKLPGDNVNLFYASLSFICGFSERLGKDMVTSVERKVLGEIVEGQKQPDKGQAP